MEHGIFVVSLDFELFWGLAGWSREQLTAYRPNVEGATDALKLILQTLSNFGIKCTIGFVGGINYKNLRDYLQDAPVLRPSYTNEQFSSYNLLLKLVEDGVIEEDLLFRQDVITELKNNALVELASHTFSHYYALEDGQTVEQFNSDIKASIDSAKVHGLNLKSIIFPRNQVPCYYYKVCVENGFTHVRGNEESYLYRSESTPYKYDIRRVLRILDSYINLTGHHTYNVTVHGHLCDVKASRFFRPYNTKLKLLESFKVRRIKNDIQYAAMNKEIYHLWWHPHNFGVNTDENIKQLESICQCFAEMQNKYGMQSLFMREF